MKLRANKVLGIAVGDKSMLIAEAAIVDGAARIVRASEFRYGAGQTLAQPDALGRELAQHLGREGFGARAAFFGLAARWILSKPRELPPVDPTLVADLLRMSVESEFSAELKDLAFDYAGESSAASASQVLLLATPQKHLEQIDAIAAGAKLEVKGVAPTIAVLAARLGARQPDAVALSVSSCGVEMAGCRGKSVAMLRHIAAAGPLTQAMAGEVRRTMMTLPQAAGGLLVFDESASGASAQILGAAGKPASAADLGRVEPAANNATAPAAALALAAAEQRTPVVNFARSKLAVVKKRAVQRQTALAIAAVLAVILLGIFAYVDLQHQERDLADLKSKLADTAQTRKSAQGEVDMIRYAQGWHASQPRYLDCLKDLTLAIPEEANMYVTSFDLHESMKGAVNGKAPADKSVLSLVERLKSSRRFTEVKLAMDTKDARSGREVSFAINFRYVPRQP